MANKILPKGAEPVGRIERLETYKADVTLYPGDFVMKTANGTATTATASSALLGVAMHYAAAGADVLVADHPDQEFAIMADGATPATQADLGYNYDITPSSPNTTYKRSQMQLASASKATTATLPLRLLRIAKDVDNSMSANAKCVVRINNHQNGSGTGVAGI